MWVNFKMYYRIQLGELDYSVFISCIQEKEMFYLKMEKTKDAENSKLIKS